MASKTLGSFSDADPFISPRYRSSDWKALDLGTNDKPDWARAVDIFWDRIYGRFLAPIEAIMDHTDTEILEFSGFTIIAIDCLLIETMNQFYRGENETSGLHSDAFWDFFRESKHFQSEFDTKQKAIIFYRHFRCGILHQAQTKKSSKIRILLPRMIQLSVPNNVDEGLVIDRLKFHEALTNEIKDYAERILNPTTQRDFNLRSNFVRKMSFIAP